jgi:hypothetical protein
MKNISRQFCWLLLDAAATGNSLASIRFTTFLVAIWLMGFCSLPAFAANQTNPTSVTNPPSPPPPPTAPMPPTPAVPFDASMQLTPEEGREYWDRYVTGDWWGLRTLLHNKGIDFNLDYFSEMATNLSGGKDNFSGYNKNEGQETEGCQNQSGLEKSGPRRAADRGRCDRSRRDRRRCAR